MISVYSSQGKRWGKKRVPDCECSYNFTCRTCLVAGLQEGMPQRPPKQLTEQPHRGQS